ncbi:MAG: hypothetical protein SFH39_13375 [Candidatus Magnetobacterium sp. LHC-1]|uniref:Uncharacterized protein n=1 Tax=Candidatus Magnetobacterium casense TaxID=1455061 RepID=A0ABS6S1F1_9BACT|nr:hypothetical protein [Candidatus Magnetobacterium casensis]MBF0608527.1 hypothetical protein [Nitrospirota bacterium]MBV6342675.1 hypothetical protein [Candidatus Magnetobacterium casensis]
MVQKDYEANLETTIAYMRQDQRRDAVLSLKTALAQVPLEDKVADNTAYLKILAMSARFTIEDGDYTKASYYISEGLKLKRFYADFLFLNTLIFKVLHQHGDMLTSIIGYLISIDLPDVYSYGYDFVNDAAIKEMLDVYLPLAYTNTPNHAQIQEVIEGTMIKMKEVTSGQYIESALNIMRDIDNRAN